ncbi:hypothetical protein L1987_53001 [Smallanthus sonchifolius]|uniref:Uncharacterized protein n=1 Tax=Smallanthus sonchifolius TaxID=185202 RepID=A0ACB9EUD4_9ASTR|nr:hypothetical protein L1987_53001 [Smallanthus sonchifolius]
MEPRSHSNGSASAPDVVGAAIPPPAPPPMSKVNAPPPFLVKTYDMVDDSSTDKVVSQSATSNSFVMWDPPEFARDLLPKYFKHNIFSSFVRQLNTYGFRKVDPNCREFANEGFLCGQKHLLKTIVRRKSASGHPQPPQQTSSVGACVEVGKFGLEEEVERLKRDKNVLMKELVRLRQQQQSTDNQMQSMVQRLQGMEQRQQQMMSFLAKAVNSPGGIVIEFGSIGRHETTHNIQNEEAEDIDGIHSDEIPTSSVEGSVTDAIDVQNEVAEVLPYNFLIKIPRCEDENLKDQIRSAQLLVFEKTRLRDVIRMEIQGKRARLKAHNEAYNVAKTDETIARWIFNMEHMIQHETLLLKDEKQFVHEIKQLKTLRDQLASNMGSSEEIQQVVDQKDHNEEHDVRQKAYAQLNSLKKLSYDKNKTFRQFKEDLMAARDIASLGNKDALYRLCMNQVETFMEQWNNNDEFRKKYISGCNMNVSRRQSALDGGSLVLDDVAPALPVVLLVEEGKIVSSTEKKQTDDNNNNTNNKSIENESGQKNQTLTTKGVAKPKGSDDVPVVSELTVENKKEEENTLKNEDIELAKKAEELRKEEIAAKLKEQRRLEEKAKAIEALERKKRNAEKAQIRADLRAHKEAEQKEKEKEKRLRKKEEKKKTGGGDESINGEEAAAASSESANEAAAKDTETVPKEKNKKKPATPPPYFFSKQLKPKPIPPPLVNRNKKRWQQWGNWLLLLLVSFCCSC